MKLLAIDTSADACSVALSINGDIEERFQIAPREHTYLVLPMIDDLLKQAGIRKKELDALAFAQGPGGFTGLRIAAGVVQGIALGLDIPTIQVSSLAALAQGIVRKYQADNILAAFDARMSEVYWGVYSVNKAGLVELKSEEQVCAPTQITAPKTGQWVGAGSGWTQYKEDLEQNLNIKPTEIYPDTHPHAQDVAVLAIAKAENEGMQSAEHAIPIYLRNQIVHSR